MREGALNRYGDNQSAQPQFGTFVQFPTGFGPQLDFPGFDQCRNQGEVTYNGYDRFGNRISKPAGFSSTDPGQFDNQQLDDSVFPAFTAIPSTTVPPTTFHPTDYGHQPAPISPEVIALRELFEAMKKQMNKMALGKDAKGFINPKEIQTFQKNLKVPDLEKFDGSSCPRIHIQSYMMAMSTKGFDKAGM